MARISVIDVTDIIATTLDNTQVGAFIDTANLLVTQKLGARGLDDMLLAEIEKYLAAHLVCLRDPRMQTKSVSSQMGTANTSYQGRTAMRLEATQYGQTVQMLDPTGTFAAAGLRAAKFEVF